MRWFRRSRNRLLGLLPLGLMILTGCHKLPPKSLPETRLDQDATPWQINQPGALRGKKLLVVHSYHPEYPWVASISAGIRDSLAGTGLEVETFYMDTKRNNTEAWKRAKGAEARQRVEHIHPDVVITCDDNAQSYFARELAGSDLPIVFCGVNEDPSKYGFPASNITGVIERPHYQQTLEMVASLVPVKRIALISNDDATSRAVLAYAKEQSAGRDDIQLVETVLTNDYREWQRAVQRFGRTVDAFGIYTYHTLRSPDADRSLDPAVVIQWTVANAQKPTFGFLDFSIQSGLLAGVVESGEEQGRLAGGYVKALLTGTPADHLPIIRGTRGQRMFNLNTAKRFGIQPPNDADLRTVKEP